jgi:flagellar biosynthesis GTPase FlhF
MNNLGHQTQIDPKVVVIKNIPRAIKKEELAERLRMMCLPCPIRFNYNYEKKLFTGIAFADFESCLEATKFMDAVNDMELAGRKLRAEYKIILPAIELDRVRHEKWERQEQDWRERQEQEKWKRQEQQRREQQERERLERQKQQRKEQQERERLERQEQERKEQHESWERQEREKRERADTLSEHWYSYSCCHTLTFSRYEHEQSCGPWLVH